MTKTELKQLIKEIIKTTINEGRMKDMLIYLNDMGFNMVEDDVDYITFKNDQGFIITLNNQTGTWNLEEISNDQRNITTYLRGGTFENLRQILDKFIK